MPGERQLPAAAATKQDSGLRLTTEGTLYGLQLLGSPFGFRKFRIEVSDYFRSRASVVGSPISRKKNL